MTDPTLDLRFAWRWLLPLQELRQVSLFGFDKTETDFWQSVLSASEIFCDGQEANAWIVDADHHHFDNTLNSKSLEHANLICVVGSNEVVRRWKSIIGGSFSNIREYGMLPSSAPRVVVPLDSPRNAMTGLRLHRPGRRLVRLYIGVAGLLARAGIFFPLRKRILLIAVRTYGSSPIGVCQGNVPAGLNEAALNYAMYLGTSDRNRKTVVLPLGMSKPETIIKVAESPAARQSLKQEFATLESLRCTPIGGNVPKLTGLVENEQALTMFQEYRPRRTVFHRQFDQSVTDFLARLSNINRSCRPLTCILEEILPDGAMPTVMDNSPFVLDVYKRLQTLAATGAMVWEHRSHGDFAPWNCSLSEQGIFVFDWENSQEREVAFGDAFYFTVAPTIHIAGHPNIHKVRLSALNRANDVSLSGGLAVTDIWLYWALWLLKRAIKEYHPLYKVLL